MTCHTATHYTTLHHTTLHYSRTTLQHTAPNCTTLQQVRQQASSTSFRHSSSWEALVSLLQPPNQVSCVALCCTVLQCVECVAVSVDLQFVAVYCSICCSVLPVGASCCSVPFRSSVLQCVAACCSALQCAAVCAAVCCSVLHQVSCVAVYMSCVCVQLCM